MTTKLQQYIRPRALIRASQKSSLVALFKDDIKGVGADPPRTIANGIKAIIGAVYFDSGFDSARRLMDYFGLTIKLPEPKPGPMPEFGQTVKYA
jgi:dsRNA-specific ribonuclease